MKNLIKVLGFVILLMGTAIVYNASHIKRTPFGWKKIIHTAGDKKTITTRDTSLAFKIDHTMGVTTLWFDSDVSGLSPASDSCMTIGLLLRNKEIGQWGKYYKGSNPTRLDTIKRSLINNSDGVNSDVYFPLALHNGWAWADSAKIVVSIGSADKIKLQVMVGGQ